MTFRWKSKERFLGDQFLGEQVDGGVVTEGYLQARNLGAAIDAIRNHLRTTNLDGAGWESGSQNDDGTFSVRLLLYRQQRGKRWVKLGEFECDDRYMPLIEPLEKLVIPEPNAPEAGA